jgi:hypothetical protein
MGHTKKKILKNKSSLNHPTKGLFHSRVNGLVVKWGMEARVLG